MKVEEYSAQKSAAFQNLADAWNISNNDFIRNSEPRHKVGAQEFWRRAVESGDVYKKSYTGLYCVGCESFKTEKDLVNGICPIHNKAPEELSEENYFFKLSKYAEPLQFLFSERPDFVIPDNRFTEVKNILASGLEDVSISRSRAKLPWGISVPGDDSQVMYVWFDELVNYVTALGFGSTNTTLLETYWPAIHLIGKDINRFHALLWPAMLMSAGIEPPKQLVVHGFLNVNGQKMSKSVGNVINPSELIEKYPLEAVRYFFMREVPFDNDGNFSDEQFVDRFNGDLANGLGNLTNRVLTMIEKYSNSTVPKVTIVDNAFVDLVSNTIWPEYSKFMNGWRFDRALESAWKFVTYCDQQISDRAPWALAKAGKNDEVNNLLYHLAESLRHIAVMIWPVMPETAENILTQLGLSVENEKGKPLSELMQWVDLTVGNKIQKGGALFPRLS